jgi:hypothetical protein
MADGGSIWRPETKVRRMGDGETWSAS